MNRLELLCLTCENAKCISCIFLEYVCHVYVRDNNLSGVLISDAEYPSRVAFTLLGKVSEL